MKRFPLSLVGFVVIPVLFNRSYSAFTDVPHWEYRITVPIACFMTWLVLLSLTKIKAERLFSVAAALLLLTGFTLQVIVIHFAKSFPLMSVTIDLTVVVSAICTGVGYAIYLCLWTAVFERMRPAVALIGIASSVGLAAVFSTLPILVFSPFSFGAVTCSAIRIALLVVSLSLLFLSQRIALEPDTIDGGTKPKRGELRGYLWRATGAIAVASFVVGGGYGNDRGYGGSVRLAAIVLSGMALSMIIVAIAWRRGERPGFLNAIYTASTAFGLVLLLVSITVQNNAISYFWVLQYAATPLFDIVILGTLASAHTIFKIPVHRLVCAVLCLKELAYLSGNLLESRISGDASSTIGVVVILAYLLMLLVVGTFDSLRDSSRPSIPQELSVAMSTRYRLTPREVDVLRLLLQGSSYDRIGKQLYIASSTVKTHVNHIYSKMGVESRDQFIDLMNPSDRCASDGARHAL